MVEGPEREDYDGRISRTEAGLENLTSMVRTLASSMDSMRGTVQAHMERSGRTNWPAIGGAGALLLTIVSMLGSGYVRDLGRIESKLTDVDQHDWERQYTRGVADQRIGQAETAIVKLDTDLQREMRLVDDKTRTQIEALDRRLQTEFAPTIAALKDAQAKLLDYNAVSHEIHARQEQQLKTLESRP